MLRRSSKRPVSEFVFDGNAGQRRPNDNTFRVFKDDDESLTLRQGFFIEYLMVGWAPPLLLH